MIHYFISNPKKLFLVDGIGAFITAFFLFVVFRTYHEQIGMSINYLNVLAFIGSLFCLYSFCCFLFVRNYQKFHFQIIAIANLGYCLFTLGLVIFHFKQLTVLGIGYFSIETIIITCLAFIELKTSNALTIKN